MALNNHKVYILALFFVLSIFATIPISRANIGELDEYLQKKANQSLEETREAFVPNPEDLADIFNQEVGKALISENVTRRHLYQRGKRGGVCEATNPIDKCWRCARDWAKHRKRLADCAQGFGYRVTGGKLGKIYVVTDPSDDDFDHPKPGTLRHAVIQLEPLWIIFKNDMVITLQKELICTSDKTIDGRGVEVRIAFGAGFTLQFVHNVIIHNIRIHDTIRTSGGMIRDSVEHIGIRTESDGDGINIFGSNNIWIDHVSLARGADGLIDVIEGSTAITISNCKFNNHNDVMLLGANDATSKDALMQVTIAFNHFGKGLIQRMPRIRWGFAHVVNNDYTQWELYAIGGSAHPTILSQGNRFKASNNPYTKQVTKRDYATQDQWMKWQWRSEGDIFLNGAFFTESGSPAKPSKVQDNLIKFQPGDFVGTLTKFAGALNCNVGQPC